MNNYLTQSTHIADATQSTALFAVLAFKPSMGAYAAGSVRTSASRREVVFSLE